MEQHPHSRRHARIRRSGRLLRRLREADQGGWRHRRADPRHRPHRPHRLQRAGQPAQQPHTRMVTLDSITRRDAAGDFFGEENVPIQAITMGVASILDARRSLPDGVRRAQGWHRVQGRRATADRGDLGELPSGTPGRDGGSRRGRGRGTDRDQAAVGGRAVRLDAGTDPQGRRQPRADGEEGIAEAQRRRFPRTPPLRTPPREGTGARRSAKGFPRPHGDDHALPGRPRRDRQHTVPLAATDRTVAPVTRPRRS